MKKYLFIVLIVTLFTKGVSTAQASTVSDLLGKVNTLIAHVHQVENVLPATVIGSLDSSLQDVTAAVQKVNSETTPVVQPLGYTFSKSLSRGTSGEDVKKLQEVLKQNGYFQGEATGLYGPVTAEAVKTFQTDKGLESVGIVGPKTRTVLTTTAQERGICADGGQHIKVVTPNGGETGSVGTTRVVRWLSCNIPASTLLEINIYSPNGTFGFLAPNGTPNDGNESITIGNLPTSSDYIITVGIPKEGFNNSALLVSDSSDAPFTISGKSVGTVCPINTPNITVLSPNGGEIYKAGQQIEVKWKTCNISTGTNMSIWLNNETVNASTGLVADYVDVPNTGSATVTLPTNSKWSYLRDGKNYTVTVAAPPVIENQSIMDKSDTLFTINSTVATSCAQTKSGMEKLSLSPDSPLAQTVQAGANSVEITRVSIENIGTEDICNLNGLQIGSYTNINTYVTNVRVINVTTGAQVGSAANTFSFNGNYYWNWVQGFELPLLKGSTTIFKIVGDIQTTAPSGDFKLGLFGVNHSGGFGAGGYYGSPIVGNMVTVGTANTNSKSCDIDLVKNTNTCTGSIISILQQANQKALVKLNLEPSLAGFDAQAKIDVTFSKEIPLDGWNVDIGDSASNDGYAGDGGTQSNDAELQILSAKGNSSYTFDVYGNDQTPAGHTKDGHRLLADIPMFGPFYGKTASFTLGNEFLQYSLPGTSIGLTNTLQGANLYKLAGQSDTEGAVNYNLFAAFNRVIAGDYRSGTGVEKVHISILPGLKPLP